MLEVGGCVSHGALVAREYGLPAVVSVTGVTREIRTGQRVRVDGGRGVVEVLDGAAGPGAGDLRNRTARSTLNPQEHEGCDEETRSDLDGYTFHS